ncbi:MAG: Ig-like domain-containing protein [Xenococcaceae cyanobacterium]
MRNTQINKLMLLATVAGIFANLLPVQKASAQTTPAVSIEKFYTDCNNGGGNEKSSYIRISTGLYSINGNDQNISNVTVLLDGKGNDKYDPSNPSNVHRNNFKAKIQATIDPATNSNYTSATADAVIAALDAIEAKRCRVSSNITLTGTVRDFKNKNETGGHPDFQKAIATEKNLVTTTLGTDKKPIYNTGVTTTTTTGKANFDQWYRDVAGVNMSKLHDIVASDGDDKGNRDGIYTYTSNNFFPINGQLFGNTPGESKNFHFTYEIHTQFTYEEGTTLQPTTFKFTGDDDVWVYINGQRVIDLGGVHSAQSQEVNIDDLGLTPGQTYTLDLFFAERHTSQSNFRIDTSAVLQDLPAVTLNVATSSTSSTSVISGTSDPNSTVTVKLDVNKDGTPEATYQTTSNDSGNWSIDLKTATPTSGSKPTSLDGDEIKVTVTSQNNGQQSSTSEALAKIDIGIPTPTVTSSSVSNDTTPTFSGTTAPGSTVVVKDGDTTLGSATVNDTGSWSYTPMAPLSFGIHIITITATDPAGNSASTTQTLTLDGTAPTVTIDGTANSSGTGSTITGNTEAGSTVVVKIGDTPLGETKADVNGNWSVITSTLLDPGTYTITVTATDPAGNTGTGSQNVVISDEDEEDQTPPLIGINSPANSSTTNDTTPTISGTGEVGSTVEIKDGETILDSVTVNDDNTWSYTPSSPLSNGEHTITVTATDAAGNSANAQIVVTIDTTAPTIDITSPADESSTGDTTPTISGTGEVGSTVEIKDGETILDSVTVNDDNTWSYTPSSPLTYGSHTITVTATDPAGNKQSDSVTFSISAD